MVDVKWWWWGWRVMAGGDGVGLVAEVGLVADVSGVWWWWRRRRKWVMLVSGVGGWWLRR